MGNRYSTTIGEQMPFFLVTHRSFVETDSEQSAAVKALEKLDRGRKLEFEVKFDEATTTRVLVERETNDPKLREFDPPSPDVEQTDQRLSESLSRSTTPERPSARTTILVSIFLGGLVLATFLIGAL
ncbi:hypothetical protein [Agrobacterium sp. P15N1-A]|uniref:hypothetical protein n=1 Tax=Agrobacterium sp. P15N1-A TaxID=3342820 RepID=UPI0037D486B5